VNVAVNQLDGQLLLPQDVVDVIHVKSHIAHVDVAVHADLVVQDAAAALKQVA